MPSRTSPVDMLLNVQSCACTLRRPHISPKQTTMLYWDPVFDSLLPLTSYVTDNVGYSTRHKPDIVVDFLAVSLSTSSIAGGNETPVMGEGEGG